MPGSHPDGPADPRPANASAPPETDGARIIAEILGKDRGTDPFVAAVRATRMPMIITDPNQADNPVVFTNDAFCRLTGYDRSEILGRNCRFLQGPDTDRETVAKLHAGVAARHAVQVDIRNYRKDGSGFWNRLLMAPVPDEDGNVAYFFASQVDVTLERERLAGLETENAALMAEVGDRLREYAASEARLQLATEAGQIGVWELELASGALHTSRLCRENFGRDPAAPFSYEDLQRAVHPDDRDRMLAAVAACIETGEDYQIEYRVVYPDKRVAWVHVSAVVQRGAGGKPVRMVGTSRDVTASRGAIERAAALLELDRTVFSHVEDPDEIAFRAAEALGRLFGVSRAGYGTVDKANETITIARDWNGEGITSLAGTLHFRDYGSYIEDIKRGEAVVIDDARADARTAATAEALIGISAQSFINLPVQESGDLVAMLYLNHAEAHHWSPDEVAFVREVATRIRQAAERRRAENDLRKLADSLETQVQERTAALLAAEAALRQSQKMEAVGQLTGGLAHDFNNLLTSINGSLELMQRRIEQGRVDEIERYVNTAQRGAQRAAALTHRLLAFSRRQTLDPKALNMNRLLADMEELVRRTVGPSVTIEVVGAGGLWPAFVDANQLENAVLNLCINARDAMPDGGRITIETANKWLDVHSARERDLPPGQYVTLCVTDTGTGMAPEVAAKAFDPFFTTKPLGMGTGLGLSMIYGFVRQSGGQVRIYSELGQGTTMCLYLPRHAGDVLDAEPQGPHATGTRAERGETVLVIDDEAPVRTLVREVLEEAGFAVLEAGDGKAGLGIVQSNARIDLLVTDVGLPGGMNGRQVADAARVSRPRLKVLFITGYAENAVVGNGQLDAGMAILTKPFTMTSLEAKVREAIAS